MSVQILTLINLNPPDATNQERGTPTTIMYNLFTQLSHYKGRPF